MSVASLCLCALLAGLLGPVAPTSLLAPLAPSVGVAPATAADVLVYGSTPGGVMAAVAAARQGARVVLLDPAPRVGGVCSGGLGETDKGNPVVIGGLAREFFLRNRQLYNRSATAPDPQTVEGGYKLEPHNAEAVFLAMMAEAGVVHVRTPAEAQVGLRHLDRQAHQTSMELSSKFIL